MSSFMIKADILKNKLVRQLGKRMLDEMEIDAAFKVAEDLAYKAGAEDVRKCIVSFSGEVDGKRMVSAAEVLFVRFGQGAEAAWVAFAVFDGGWANAYRPLTADTATMAWLDAYVTKELGGG